MKGAVAVIRKLLILLLSRFASRFASRSVAVVRKTLETLPSRFPSRWRGTPPHTPPAPTRRLGGGRRARGQVRQATPPAMMAAR